MIKSITVTNYLGNSLELELARPEKSGLIVKSITGLGPSKANINVTDISTNDGALFNSSRLQKRNIVFKLVYDWNNPKSIEELRLLTYSYFPIKKKLRLTFKLDQRTAYIDGYVESNEPDIFSKQSGCQISIICPDPYFYSAGEEGKQNTSFSNTTVEFEFPFENELPDEPTIEFGNIELLSANTVYYLGDAEVGITLRLHAIGTVVNPSIYNITTREQMSISSEKLEKLTGANFHAGDDIIICTVKGSKSVTLLREGKTTNILNCLDKNSNWFQLSQGDNLFSYTADDGSDRIIFEIENRIIYEGI